MTLSGVSLSVVTGAAGGFIGGGYYNPSKDIYASGYFDVPSHINQLKNVLGQKYSGNTFS